MSAKKRILFIANEISPFLEITEFAEIINKLAIKSNELGWEVRCIMPRFGTINERRHRLHEVVRLSGININLNNEDYPLQIKVASLPNARLQIYFLENEELFKRRFIFHDAQNKWFDDNHLRTIFFCKGALEMVRKFGWPPHIIHCSGWMTGLIPMYLKTAYKTDPVFTFTKSVYTLGSNTFTEKMDGFLTMAAIHPAIKPKHLIPYKESTNTAFFRGGATYADMVTVGTDTLDKQLDIEFNKPKSKTFLNFKGFDTDLSEYIEIYNKLIE